MDQSKFGNEAPTKSRFAHKKKRVQRIKMRIVSHPVKLDGTITAFAADGESFTVEFDGPYPTTTFYLYRNPNFVTDKKPINDSGGFRMAVGAKSWEVL